MKSKTQIKRFWHSKYIHKSINKMYHNTCFKFQQYTIIFIDYIKFISRIKKKMSNTLDFFLRKKLLNIFHWYALSHFFFLYWFFPVFLLVSMTIFFCGAILWFIWVKQLIGIPVFWFDLPVRFSKHQGYQTSHDDLKRKK